MADLYDKKKSFAQMTPQERLMAVQQGYNDYQNEPMGELVQAKLQALKQMAQPQQPAQAPQQFFSPEEYAASQQRYNQVKQKLIDQERPVTGPRDVLNKKPVDNSDQEYQDLLAAFGPPDDLEPQNQKKRFQP